jgi:NADPH-dependent 2,4-dienoyl-CoA reductase/sulfur reductase-like enzyme
MRAYGKDFDRYVESGKNKYGINLIRSRVGGVSRREDGQLLLKSCAPDGTQAEAAYDLVVLSTGFKAAQENVSFFRQTGVRTDQYGFVACDPFAAPATSREGIFACGAASGPKDIPETVTEASAAEGVRRHAGELNGGGGRRFAPYFAGRRRCRPGTSRLETSRAAGRLRLPLRLKTGVMDVRRSATMSARLHMVARGGFTLHLLRRRAEKS